MRRKAVCLVLLAVVFLAGCDTVFEQYKPPKANIAIQPQELWVEKPVIFDAGGSHSGSGEIVEYEWTINGQYAGGSKSFQRIFYAEGRYFVALRVTNSYGLTDTVSAEFRVQRLNIAPSIEYSPKNIEVGDVVTFYGSADTWITAKGLAPEEMTYRWTIAGHILEGRSVQLIFYAPGEYPVRLVVKDSHTGAKGEATTVVEVESPPLPPAPEIGIISIDSAQVRAGEVFGLRIRVSANVAEYFIGEPLLNDYSPAALKAELRTIPAGLVPELLGLHWKPEILELLYGEIAAGWEGYGHVYGERNLHFHARRKLGSAGPMGLVPEPEMETTVTLHFKALTAGETDLEFSNTELFNKHSSHLEVELRHGDVTVTD